MKQFARFLIVAALVTFIAIPVAQSAQKKVDNSKQQVEQAKPSQSQQQLSTAAESKDPHWKPSPKKVDLVITQVRITRHPDQGKIGIHARIKNIGNKSTSEIIRVVFRDFETHVFIHGIRSGETKDDGFLINDNAHHNRAVGPLTVEVNPDGEITESHTHNNTCTGARLSSTQDHSTYYCPF